MPLTVVVLTVVVLTVVALTVVAQIAVPVRTVARVPVAVLPVVTLADLMQAADWCHFVAAMSIAAPEYCVGLLRDSEWCVLQHSIPESSGQRFSAGSIP